MRRFSERVKLGKARKTTRPSVDGGIKRLFDNSNRSAAPADASSETSSTSRPLERSTSELDDSFNDHSPKLDGKSDLSGLLGKQPAARGNSIAEDASYKADDGQQPENESLRRTQQTLAEGQKELREEAATLKRDNVKLVTEKDALWEAVNALRETVQNLSNANAELADKLEILFRESQRLHNNRGNVSASSSSLERAQGIPGWTFLAGSLVLVTALAAIGIAKGRPGSASLSPS